MPDAAIAIGDEYRAQGFGWGHFLSFGAGTCAQWVMYKPTGQYPPGNF
jgi:hypothetical protein